MHLGKATNVLKHTVYKGRGEVRGAQFNTEDVQQYIK